MTNAHRLARLAEQTAQVQTPLTRLDYLTELIEAAELLRVQSVEEARRAGESWHAIGTNMGMTKQAAQQRYGKKPTPAPATETPLPGMPG